MKYLFRLFFLTLLLSFFIVFLNFSMQNASVNGAGQTVQHQKTSTSVQEMSVPAGSGESARETDMAPLFFVILALFIGAATRQFLKKTPLPFTVSLLIIGLLLGAFVRSQSSGSFSLWGFPINFSYFGEAVRWAGNINPHMILYVFLPTLIFEAAFGMNFHTFKKTAFNASLLAIPGIFIAMLLTGVMVIWIDRMGLGLHGWGWPIAFMFGAVVSATDPVAVVALLKELGASKKLGTLIEGESMINDGTAIVLFTVFAAMVTGKVTDSSPVLEFVRVSVGGVLIGLIVGSLTISWVRRVFNDALVEISVIIAAAYITFYLCEHYFHVSGVLGLVTLGLTMASVGKTRISPEVEKFLHEFWELAAFIANTLIFIIVGVVIAQQTHITGKNILILLIIYAGIHVIRAIVIALFFPIMRKSGYGLPVKDAVALWYGALRGAVGLALALMVAGEESIPPQIREEFLFLTAGLVTLTLLINATTIKFVVNKLGLTRISKAKMRIQENAQKYLVSSTLNALEKVKTDRFLNRANWNSVRNFLNLNEDNLAGEATSQMDTVIEYRRRILEKEKSSYWHQFTDGMLGSTGVIRLTETIENIIDTGGLKSLSDRKDLEETWKTGKFIEWLQKVPLLAKLSRRRFFENLAVSYDSARAFVEAQDDALKLVESMVRGLETEETVNREEGEKILQSIEEEITENKIHGLTFIRNLRKNYPEIYTAIATRQAIRSLLNYQRRTVERLLKNGRIETSEADKMIKEIEQQMKKLLDSPPEQNIPETFQLLQESSLFNNIDPDILHRIIPLMQTRIFTVGERILKENTTGDGLYFIARGTVRITSGTHDVEILGKGNFIGELAGLTGRARSAGAFVESPATLLHLSINHLSKITREFPEFSTRLWRIGALRLAENFLRKTPPFNHWKHEQLKLLIQKGEIISPERYELEQIKEKLIILISGQAFLSGASKANFSAPCILDPELYHFSPETLLFIC